MKWSLYSEGYDDPNGLGQTAAIVLHMMDGCFDKGYSLYTGNYHNSVPLTEMLTTRSTYISGTLRNDRNGLSKSVTKTKL